MKIFNFIHEENQQRKNNQFVFLFLLMFFFFVILLSTWIDGKNRRKGIFSSLVCGGKKRFIPNNAEQTGKEKEKRKRKESTSDISER